MCFKDFFFSFIILALIIFFSQQNHFSSEMGNISVIFLFESVV